MVIGKEKMPANFDRKKPGQVLLAPVSCEIQYLQPGYLLWATATSSSAATATAQRRQWTHRCGHFTAALGYRRKNRDCAFCWLFAVRTIGPCGVHGLQLLEFMVTSGADVLIQRHNATSSIKSVGQVKRPRAGFGLNLTKANMKSQGQHHR